MGVREERRVQRDLVVRAQHGDVEAFSTLARGASSRLYAVAYRILRDPDAADDATQQALIAAWDHLVSLRDPDRFDAWTYRLVLNAASKEARRAARGRLVAVLSGSAAGVARGDSPDPGGELAERDALERAFARLSPEHRAVVVLHHYADLPMPEIARILGVPVGTVGSRLHNALGRLRLALGVQAPEVSSRESPVT